MKNPSLKKSLPALLALTGSTLATTALESQAANTAPRPPAELDTLEARIQNVKEKLSRHEQPGLAMGEKTSPEDLQTFWWGNWRNGGWGPGVWHNWGNGGWPNWRNGWGNGGWHNWHNWHNWGNW